ncbi:sensor histidine kinase [soil metagenome]
MTPRRWWLLAMTVACLLSAVSLALNVGIGPLFFLGAAVLVAYLVFWALVFKPNCEVLARNLSVLGVTVLVAGLLPAIDPSLAFFQAIAFPAVWTVLRTIRWSIVASAAVAVATGAGFIFRLGLSNQSVALAVGIEGLSFVFAIAMGIWITRISILGEERRVLLDELTAAQAQLEVLHRDAGATGERERLARELHDTIAQSLTGMVLLTQRSRRELASGALNDGTLAMIEDGARDALVETRSLVAAGAPVDLGAGIADALQRLGERFEREAGIQVLVSADLHDDVDRDTQVVLLRCAQEGLANVRKHAAAAHARVELTVDDLTATVRVIDDGQGFAPDEAAPGFGLRGLRDRLGLVGGELTVDGTPGATTLTARLPLGAPA